MIYILQNFKQKSTHTPTAHVILILAPYWLITKSLYAHWEIRSRVSWAGIQPVMGVSDYTGSIWYSTCPENVGVSWQQHALTQCPILKSSGVYIYNMRCLAGPPQDTVNTKGLIYMHKRDEVGSVYGDYILYTKKLVSTSSQPWEEGRKIFLAPYSIIWA